jgi:hypothetical protein
MTSSLSNYKYKGVSLDSLLATTQPAIDTTTINSTDIITALNLSTSSNYYKANAGYGNIKVGDVGYSYQNTGFDDYLPTFFQINNETQSGNLDVTGFNKIAGFLVGAGGGGGGGGGANRGGNNHNGGSGGNAQRGQLVGFESGITTNSIYISVGNKGTGGGGGGNRPNRDGTGGSGGNAGNSTFIKVYETDTNPIAIAAGGGKGNGGGGGTPNQNGSGGNTESNYTSDNSIFTGGCNLTRNGGNGGSKGNSGNMPTPESGNDGSHGGAVIFLIKN